MNLRANWNKNGTRMGFEQELNKNGTRMGTGMPFLFHSCSIFVCSDTYPSSYPFMNDSSHISHLVISFIIFLGISTIVQLLHAKLFGGILRFAHLFILMRAQQTDKANKYRGYLSNFEYILEKKTQ